jgi:hypothetical protein
MLARRTACALVALVITSQSARAQTLRGTVVDEHDAPVAGVVLQLLDAASHVAARALSTALGDYTIRSVRPGSYRLQTLRIGYRPVVIDSLTFKSGDDVTRRIVLRGIPTSLQAVRTVDKSVCAAFTDSAAATFRVWEQIRTALTAADISSSARNLTATTISYERDVDPVTRRIRAQTTTAMSRTVQHPWLALSPDSLHRAGYVSTDADNVVTYNAPGLDELLSDSFVEDHCFRLEADGKEARIRFVPLPSRKSVTDIRGTIRVDAGSSELRRIEFGYANASPEQEELAGGDMDFVHMRDGTWAIGRWAIRMPVTQRRIRSMMVGGNDVQLLSLHVQGGELALARRGNDTIWTRPPLTLRGTVKDSASGAPVHDAAVSLAGTTLSAKTDAHGGFSIPGVILGEYMIETRTAAFDSVHAAHEMAFVFADSTAVVAERLPTLVQFASALCSSSHVAQAGILMGAVTGANGAIAANTPVTLQQTDVDTTRGVRARETRTDARGAFVFCDVPVGSPLTLFARTDSAEAAGTARTAEGSNLARAALVLVPRAVVASRGAAAHALLATLTGAAVDVRTLHAIPGVAVTVALLGRTAVTDSLGHFRLTDVPAGPQHLQARHFGFLPFDEELMLEPGSASSHDVILTSVPTLSGVTVVESALIPTFEEHRRMGLGRFLTRAELLPQEGHTLSAVLSQVGHGLGLVQGSGSHVWVTSSRRPDGVGPDTYTPDKFERMQGVKVRCYSKVYLDNSLLNSGKPTPPFDANSFPVERIEAIEFYQGGSEIPNKYAGLDTNCGVMVIWTRRTY